MEVRLLVVQGRPRGKRLVFPHGSYVFGRGAECHVRPDSEWVSRQHCQLLVTSTTTAIRDLGSRNGTLVNGERVVGERDLADGDQIQIGPLVFEVELEKAKPAPLPVADQPAASPLDETQPHRLETAEVPALTAPPLPGDLSPTFKAQDCQDTLPLKSK